jgi:hypothetical protein
MQTIESIVTDILSEYIPPELQNVEDLDTAIPELAKNTQMIASIEAAIRHINTYHELHLTDARNPPSLPAETVHLVVTSPPYWTLKRYRETEGQLGHVENYEEFLDNLDNVWRWVYRALAPGGKANSQSRFPRSGAHDQPGGRPVTRDSASWI